MRKGLNVSQEEETKSLDWSECLTIVVTPQMVSAIGEFLANTVAGCCNYTTRNITELDEGEPLPAHSRLAAMFCGDKWWVASLFKRGNATFWHNLNRF